jgi:hypothetical protein
MTHSSTNCQPASKPINYTVSFDSPLELASILRHKVDSLGIVFNGLAEDSGYNQSALVGILLLFHDIQQHAALLEEFFLEQQRAKANCKNPVQ